MKITSPEFVENGLIPKRFTCEGENVSPLLVIEDVPEETASLCLVMDDPDAPGGTFTHWVVYNLPPKTEILDDSVSFNTKFFKNVEEGVNSFGRTGYGGPCPPRGAGDHHYFFHLYAVKCELDLPKRANRRVVLEAIRKCLLDETVLMGRFGRN
jgi:Raf kinase inhibitor-like YbhB/YbcL family protein